VGPITFIVQLGAAAASPGDTARPIGAAAQDASDFVVEEETADLADFVVGEEAGDDADFVVAEPVADDEADFVVAEPTDDTAIGDVADFVASEEPATEEGADFVVAAEADEEADAAEVSDTVQMDVEDVAAKRKAKAPRAAKSKPQPAPEAEKAAEAEETAEAVAEEKPKKPGLFGRLFKKKDKKAAKAEPAPAAKPAKGEPAPVAKPSKASKTPTPEPAPAAAAHAEGDDTNFFVSDDDAASGGAKPVGEDELADFLMGLNEKDQ
jgi:hypothetical protein